MVLPVSQKTYFVCTIPDVSEFLLSLRQKIRQKFIPVIKGGQLCSDKARILTFIFTNLFRRIEHTIALRLFENCTRKFLENRQAPIKVKTFTKGQKKSKCNKPKMGSIKLIVGPSNGQYGSHYAWTIAHLQLRPRVVWHLQCNIVCLSRKDNLSTFVK